MSLISKMVMFYFHDDGRKGMMQCLSRDFIEKTNPVSCPQVANRSPVKKCVLKNMDDFCSTEKKKKKKDSLKSLPGSWRWIIGVSYWCLSDIQGGFTPSHVENRIRSFLGSNTNMQQRDVETLMHLTIDTVSHPPTGSCLK